MALRLPEGMQQTGVEYVTDGSRILRLFNMSAAITFGPVLALYEVQKEQGQEANTMRTMKMQTVGLAVAAAMLLPAGLAFAHCGACGADVKKADEKKDAGCATGVCAAKEVKVAAAPAEAKAKVAKIGVDELATMIRAKTPMVILDARSGKWDDGRRIPGARSLHAGSAKEDIEAMLPDKEALVVTYCSNTKCQASPKLAARLMEMGYRNIMELPEGIDGWQAAGKEVQKPAK